MLGYLVFFCRLQSIQQSQRGKMYQILNRRWGRSGNDSYTKLLLHCNGDDASTAFKDSSRSDHTITANGNAQLDTAQKKFGVSSGLFDGTGDYLSIADHADWNMGSGKFTIDFWVRFADVSADRGFFDQYYNSLNYVYCKFDTALGVSFKFYAGVDYSVELNCGWSPAINTWYHVALIRGWGGNANDWAITIDGTQIGSTLTDADNWPNIAALFRIGLADSAYMNGHLDEFRISKGIARWTANFTVPSAPYR